MEKKKYYAITTSIIYEKTVLVPVDSVEDIDEAIDRVMGGPAKKSRIITAKEKKMVA